MGSNLQLAEGDAAASYPKLERNNVEWLEATVTECTIARP